MRIADRLNTRTQRLVMTAMMMCLILVGTIVLRIPIPMTQGYVHLGDAMIFLGVMLLGRRDGAIAAGLGSALGDILGGFAFWAPWTLIVKFLMGLTTGIIMQVSRNSDISHKKQLFLDIAAMTAGGLVMTFGYFITETVMYGSAATAALGIPWNIGQFAAGIAVSLIIAAGLEKVRI